MKHRDALHLSSAEPAALLFAAFCVQVYALASVWGKGEFLPDVGNFAGAFLSRAHGMRHMTEAVVVLAPGLAILLERWSRTPFLLISGLGFLLALWNLLLVCEYLDGLLPEDAGLDPRALVAGTLRFITAQPWLVMVLVEALALICLVLLWGNDEPPIATAPGPEPTSWTAALMKWGSLVLLLAALLAPLLAQGPRV